MSKTIENPFYTLQAEAKNFSLGKIVADKNDTKANSGEAMYSNLFNTDFVINEKEIDCHLIRTLIEGAKKDHKFDDVWKDYYHSIPNNKEIAVKADLQSFYDSVTNLLKFNKTENNRPFAKGVLKAMFEYADSYGMVPKEAIIEELVTNCNDAGYFNSLIPSDSLKQYGLQRHDRKKTVNIDYDDINRIKVRSKVTADIKDLNAEKTLNLLDNRPEFNHKKKWAGQLDGSLEFILETKTNGNTSDVEYNNGKLLLIVPKEIKNYNIKNSIPEIEFKYSKGLSVNVPEEMKNPDIDLDDNVSYSRNLLDVIVEYFQELCEKLGFVKKEYRIEHDVNSTFTPGRRIYEPTVTGKSEEKEIS